MPDIVDIHDFLHFYTSLGVTYSFKKNTLHLDTRNISLKHIDTSRISRTRASVYLMAGLLSRFGKAKIPFPSGDKIGKRPIDEHIDGYIAMGYKKHASRDEIVFSGHGSNDNVKVTAYFAVTATANLIMGAATRMGITRVELAAFEPHIFNLIDFLRSAGVQIDVYYDHTIVVYGNCNLTSKIQHEVISDYLQSGTFIII